MPRPIPPTKPYPTTTSQYCSIDTPTAEIRNPLQKQHIEMNMAQRGPLLSTLVPNSAADRPSITMPSVNGIALATPEMPSDVSSGFLNTLQA